MNPPKLRWIVFSATIMFFVAVLITSCFREKRKLDELSAELDKRIDELVRIELETQRLKREIKYYSTPEGIARIATDKFNLVKSGDKLYKLETISGEHLN